MGIERLVRCIGCGAWVPDMEYPTHRYLGASPGCWALYGQVLAKEYSEYRYPPYHRMTVDAYAVQHPGTPSPQTIQSAAVHLIRLYLVLERGFDVRRATEAMSRATQHKQSFVWLEPSASLGAITVVDVAKAKDQAEHEQLVRQWAASAWEAWSSHHDTVRRWAGLYALT